MGRTGWGRPANTRNVFRCRARTSRFVAGTGGSMSIRKLNPYLNFNGTAAKAIKLYESALGAKVENVMPWTDMPGQPPSPESKDRLMHAVLRIGEGVVMLSDSPP